MSNKQPVLPEVSPPTETKIIKNAGRWKTPLAIGISTLGQVRFEWAAALQHMVLPVNLSMANMVQPYAYIAPMNYHVAEAQNLIVKSFLVGIVTGKHICHRKIYR